MVCCKACFWVFIRKLRNRSGIAFEHIKKFLGGSIVMMFYDMTMLYFEASDEDDLHRLGFSKEGFVLANQL